MPRKVSSALIGPGVGPFVRLGGVGLLRITGLPADESARLLRLTPLGEKEQVLSQNGKHEVEEAEFVRVIYEGRSRAFCALLES